jgi:hypothetical protein
MPDRYRLQRSCEGPPQLIQSQSGGWANVNTDLLRSYSAAICDDVMAVTRSPNIDKLLSTLRLIVRAPHRAPQLIGNLFFRITRRLVRVNLFCVGVQGVAFLPRRGSARCIDGHDQGSVQRIKVETASTTISNLSDEQLNRIAARAACCLRQYSNGRLAGLGHA